MAAFGLLALAEGDDWCAASVHGYNCAGNDLKHVGGITTHNDCCNACNALSGCNAWTWHYPTHDCYLKSACNNVSSSQEDHSSRPRGPAPPAPPAPPSPLPGQPSGRCGLAVVDSEAAAISNGGWLNEYG